MLDYPNAAVKSGDRLVASRDDSWGHVAEMYDSIDPDGPIVVEFEGRADRPDQYDHFDGTVNGSDVVVHIDLITEVFQLADQLTYERH